MSKTLPDSELAILLAEVKISDKDGLIRYLSADEISRIFKSKRINLDWFITRYQNIATKALKESDRLNATDRLWEILQLGALQNEKMVKAQKTRTLKVDRPVTDTKDPFLEAAKKQKRSMKFPVAEAV